MHELDQDGKPINYTINTNTNTNTNQGGSSDHDLSDRSWDSHELQSNSDDYNPDDIIRASYDSNTNSNQSSINSLHPVNHQLFNKFKACLLIFEKFVDRLAPVIFSTEGNNNNSSINYNNNTNNIYHIRCTSFTNTAGIISFIVILL